MHFYFHVKNYPWLSGIFPVRNYPILPYEYLLKHLRPKKTFKDLKIFLYALGFTISQGGIAAPTLTLMQGSEEKKKENAPQIFLIPKHATVFSATRTHTRDVADAGPIHYATRELP